MLTQIHIASLKEKEMFIISHFLSHPQSSGCNGGWVV
jgi:hypothetical protein